MNHRVSALLREGHESAAAHIIVRIEQIVNVQAGSQTAVGIFHTTVHDGSCSEGFVGIRVGTVTTEDER